MDLGRVGHLAIVAAGVLALGVAWPDFPEAAEPANLESGQTEKAAPEAPAEDAAVEAGDVKGVEQQAIFAPPDRNTLRLLTKARQLIDQDRYAEAVRCLGAIFDSPQDYFFRPDKGGPGPRSLKSEAQRLLGEMSHRGRQLYELQYGARARQMLAEAAAAGDAAGLAEVSRRFFHTQAGYEATLLLGLHHLDHGQPLAGALVLERVRGVSPAADQFEPALSLAIATCWIRAGRPEKAGQTLSHLQERDPGATIQIAGEEVPLFGENDDSLEWLTGLLGPEGTPEVHQPVHWTMYRGDASRNASTTGDGPLLSRRWRVPTSGRPDVEALIEQIRDADQEWDRWTLPALHPLVVDNVVLMRTAGNLLAVDFATGKRIWKSPVDDPFESLLNAPQEFLQRRAPQLEYALRLRMWADAAFGTISSDGQCVFAIEDLGLEIGRAQFQAVFMGAQRSDESAGPTPYNRLAAYDIHTGKLKWHIGGSPEEFGLPQAGTFLLGPPLPLLGRLYVIAESMGEIRLMALESKTGELLWSQQLAGTDQLIVKDPLRRMAGVSPSHAEGVLVCPTSNRSIVAVELATRSLLWGYTYAETDSRSQRQVIFLGARSIMDPDPSGRWIDSSVLLADGRLLATPVDSDYLHCLNLFDGELLWKEPRQDDLYVACVHEGKVVLVGERGVRAVDLHRTRNRTLEKPAEKPPEETLGEGPAELPIDEQLADRGYQRPAPAWDGRTVEFSQGSMPSGVGFLSNDLYYVPLSTAEVMAVDLNRGRPARVFRSRQGNVPGNLICCRGRIISQDATGVEAFDQLEALRTEVEKRLLAARDDADALCLQGEILWDEGKLDESIRCFRRSLELQPDPIARHLLRDALLEGLRVQFATQRHDTEQIQRLIEEPGQQAAYLRLMAVGLTAAGEFRSAWEHYLKLIELDCEHRDMEPVDESLSVRRDRWIQVQLAALRQAAPEEIQNEIGQAVAARLQAAVAGQSPEAVKRFLEYFGSEPIAAEARRHLLSQLRESGELLAAELLLWRQGRPADPELRGAALAELAQMLRQSGHHHDAAVCYARLEQELADVVCVDSKTGRELVESLPDGDPVRRQLQSGSLWPTGAVLVTKSKPETTPQPTYHQTPLGFEGDRNPFFSDVTVELHRVPLPELVSRDGLGNQMWQLPLTELARRGEFLLNRGVMRVSVCGHLMLLGGGQRLLAVDALGTTNQGSPRLLWSHDLDEPDVDPSGRGRLRIQLVNMAGGMPRIHLAALAQEPVNVPGIVSEQVLCFKRSRNCIAVDPWTGKTLWVRHGIPRDSEVFGDSRHVFLVRPGETTATVLRALDGAVLGARDVPLERERTYGRRVLVWREAEDGRVLEMIDPWDNRRLWPPKEFPANAVLHHVEGEMVAVCEPDGRVVLIDVDTGRAMIDAELEPPPRVPANGALSEILVLESPDQYMVILYDRSPEADQVRRTFQIQGLASVRIARGLVYAFDREGNKLWPSPVVVEDQWLPLNQPSRLPVLTFACMSQDRRANTRTQSKTSILCVDKRNGREICREQFLGATNSFRLVGDPEKKTVELGLQQSTVTMTFTDRPLPPESNSSGEAAKEGSSGPHKTGSASTRAIWRAVRAAITGTPSGANEP